MFKIGEKVRCVKTSEVVGGLNIGHHYTVEAVVEDPETGETFVKVLGSRFEYFSDRFVKVTKFCGDV